MDDGVGDACDQDIVVAGGDGLFEGAFHVGEGIVEEGDAGGAGVPVDALEAVAAAGGELVGEVALFGAKEGEAESGLIAEEVEDGRVVADADEDEGRVEGDGGEGVDGEAVWGGVGAEDAGHGDAGGELAAGAAEITRVQGRRFSSLQDDLTNS